MIAPAPYLLQSYRHYKGGTYTLLFLAENSENRSEWIAVYVSHLRQKVLARPWAMFIEEVEWADGARRPRFIPLDSVGGHLDFSSHYPPLATLPG